VVTTEIPSLIAGTVREIVVDEGREVPAGSVVTRIAAAE